MLCSTKKTFDDYFSTLKNILGSYQKGLKELIQLNPILFNYKNVTDRTFDNQTIKKQYAGFSAQELQKVFPESVSTDKQGYLKINIQEVFMAYINAFKELNRENNNLKTEINSIREELNELKITNYRSKINQGNISQSIKI